MMMREPEPYFSLIACATSVIDSLAANGGWGLEHRRRVVLSHIWVLQSWRSRYEDEIHYSRGLRISS